jgi:SagB-type dehydrogenase family enzyme
LADYLQDLDLAELFHENSKILPYVRRNKKGAEINSHPLILQLMSIQPKQYSNLVHVDLPAAGHKDMIPRVSLEKAIRQRQSTRRFSKHPLSIRKLSTLLYFSSAVLTVDTIDANYKLYHRAVPTSGGLNSVELYALALNIKDLKQGVYHYDSLNHRLELLRDGDFRTLVSRKLLFQSEFSNAAVILIVTSWFSKLKFKYGERGYRYAFLDAGHVGAHIYLLASALNLACCGICGFFDDEVNSLIGINSLDESAVYLLALGKNPISQKFSAQKMEDG